jgi:hypothetical protein
LKGLRSVSLPQARFGRSDDAERKQKLARQWNSSVI